MAQHDGNIANQLFPATRSDLNDALLALFTNSSGTSAPPTTYAGQWWLDTDAGTAGVLKIRDITNTTWIDLVDLGAAKVNTGEPPGVIKPYGGTSAPAGYLMCYGQEVNRVTYADLFAVIGTTFGAGNGSTTFNLPDMRGRTAIGLDNLGGSAANRVTAGVGGDATAIGKTGGSENYQLHNHTTTESAHSHSAAVSTDGAHTHTIGAVVYTSFTGATLAQRAFVADQSQSLLIDIRDPGIASAGAHTHTVLIGSSTTGIAVNNNGTGTSGNMPPWIATNWIIKT